MKNRREWSHGTQAFQGGNRWFFWMQLKGWEMRTEHCPLDLAAKQFWVPIARRHHLAHEVCILFLCSHHDTGILPSWHIVPASCYQLTDVTKMVHFIIRDTGTPSHAMLLGSVKVLGARQEPRGEGKAGRDPRFSLLLLPQQLLWMIVWTSE